MRIGFLGNTNNYPFQLAEIFKAKGYEVLFIVDADPALKLNRPEYTQMTEITYPYPSWIIENYNVPFWPSKLFPNIFAKERIKLLNTCDAVILNGVGHLYKSFLNPSIPSVSLFSGADLDINARLDEVLKLSDKFPFTLMPLFVRKMILAKYVNNLRKGISQAAVVSYFPVGFHPLSDKLIEEIMNGASYKRFEHFHIRLDNIPYTPPVPKERICIFNMARFIWKTPLPPGWTEWENKRNDIMIRGLARFIKNTNTNLDIHFVDKGIHVAESRQLAEELGLTPYITWHKEMSLKEMQDFYVKADIVFDHFGQHVLGGGLYAMAAGRPVITNTRADIFERITGVPMEVCLAANDEEVEQWLNKLVPDEAFRIAKGLASREYVRKYFDIELEADYFINAFREMTGRNN
jgi:glycosyltransferase involved in cell wall biosynthesis